MILRLPILPTVAVLAAVLAGTGSAFAQTLAQNVNACAEVAADSERLACYDRASGRAAVAAPAAAAAPPVQSGLFPSVLRDPPAVGTQAAAPRRGTGSLIDTAWGFDPDSPRYLIDSYNQNYLLFARQTSRVNNAPFVPYFAALGEPIPDGNKTEAKFQISAKARVWTTDDRQWGVWVAYTQ